MDVCIPATDGLALAATIHEADEPLAWCSLGSANGVRRRYYRRFATALAERGISVVTFDYRGIGDSPAEAEGTGPPRMRDFGEKDLEGVLRWIHAQDPARMVHVGHSGGGQFLGLAPSNHLVDRAAILGSQSGYWRLWPEHRARMWLLWHVLLPGSTRLRGHFPAAWFGMGEPLPRTVALEWARWCRHPEFIVDDDGRPIREHFEAWTGKLRAYVISDDTEFAPRPATEALVEFYANADSEIVELRPEDLGLDAIGHFGYFQKATGHWGRLADWLLG